MLDKQKFTNKIYDSYIYRDRKSIIEDGDAFLIIALIEIRESVDRYIEQRIKSDKVIEGLLKLIDNLKSKN